MVYKKQKDKYYWYFDGVTSRDLFCVVLDKQGREAKRWLIKGGVFAEKLLPALANKLEKVKNNRPWGIIVRQGEGSYSQIRLLCSLFNALAYAWGVKLATVRNIGQVTHKINKLKWQKYIKPEYQGPAVG